MAIQKRRSSRSSGGSRRTTRWVNQFFAGNAITAGTEEVIELIAANNVDTVGATILRIIGHASYAGRTVDTDTLYHAGIYLGPGTMDADDQDPAVPSNIDWMWITQRGWRQAAYDGVDSFVNEYIDIDLRSRRKFREGDRLTLNVNCTGQNVTDFWALRILLLNP